MKNNPTTGQKACDGTLTKSVLEEHGWGENSGRSGSRDAPDLTKQTSRSFSSLDPGRITDLPLTLEARASLRRRRQRQRQASRRLGFRKAPEAREGSRLGLLLAAARLDTPRPGEANWPRYPPANSNCGHAPAEGSSRAVVRVRACVPLPPVLTAALSVAAGRPSCIPGEPRPALNDPPSETPLRQNNVLGTTYESRGATLQLADDSAPNLWIGRCKLRKWIIRPIAT